MLHNLFGATSTPFCVPFKSILHLNSVIVTLSWCYTVALEMLKQRYKKNYRTLNVIKNMILVTLTHVNSMKCLKQVFRWASSLRLTIFWKWEWYIWAYTRNRRLNIVFTTSLKLGGKGAPAKYIWTCCELKVICTYPGGYFIS